MALIANITLVVLSLVLGGMLLKQYSERPRTHTLWYALGLVLLACAAYPEVAYKAAGELPTLLWWLYWASGSSAVGYLAVGTTYLIWPRFGKAALVTATVLTLAVIMATVLTAGNGPAGPESFAKAPTVAVKIPFLIQNIAGSLVILGGAAWSFYRTRSLYNLWIGLGTLIFAGGGSASGLADISQLFYFTQTLGIVLLFLGVYQSTRPRPVKASTGA